MTAIHLNKNQYPKDFYYHRTASPTYRNYLHTCGLKTFDIDHPPQFGWAKRLFGDAFGIVKYDRIDIEPDINHIRRCTGLRHGFISWIPYSRSDDEIPQGWRRLWITDHFQETGYAELVQHEAGKAKDEIIKSISTSHSYGRDQKCSSYLPYLSSWNDRAKRARKKFFSLGCRVDSVTPEQFVEAFLATRVKHWYKRDYVKYYKTMVAIDPIKIRQWLAYDVDGKVIGGLAVHDFCDTHSVHLVAFTNLKSYKSQPGTGLIDRWFAESMEMGIKYLSFDQLRNPHGPWDQKGYTEFKENFLSARLSFPKAYFRFF